MGNNIIPLSHGSCSTGVAGTLLWRTKCRVLSGMDVDDTYFVDASISTVALVFCALGMKPV